MTSPAARCHGLRDYSDVFAAHARIFDSHGFAHARLNACGYGLGAVYNAYPSRKPGPLSQAGGVGQPAATMVSTALMPAPLEASLRAGIDLPRPGALTS